MAEIVRRGQVDEFQRASRCTLQLLKPNVGPGQGGNRREPTRVSATSVPGR